MRIILEAEEAASLARHPALQDLVRYSASFELVPTTVPPRLLRLLLQDGHRWLRPSNSVRVDVEGSYPQPALPVERAMSQREAREWEANFVKAAHYRRVLTRQLSRGAVSWPTSSGRELKVVTDDGYARTHYLTSAEEEQQAEVEAAIARELARRMYEEERLAAIAYSPTSSEPQDWFKFWFGSSAKRPT